MTWVANCGVIGRPARLAARSVAIVRR